MKKSQAVFLIMGMFLFSSCYPKTSYQNSIPSESTNSQQLLVVVTDVDGKTMTSKIIDGDINNKAAIEQFAKNLAKNPGYSYAGGFWNEAGQFIGTVNTPYGKMLVAIRVAD